MTSVAETAIEECLTDLRAACHRPIDETALLTVVAWLRPQFEQILSHPDGSARWADHGHLMRNNGRYIGALADFFANREDVPVAGINQLTEAYELVRSACRVRASTHSTLPE
jgi:hypothetical protein